MWPTLLPGDLAGFSPRPAPQVGEVLVFRLAGKILAHRVVRASPQGLFLRGDACLSGEGPVCPSQALGRIEQIRRGGRTLAAPEWDRPLGAVGRALFSKLSALARRGSR